MKNRAAVEARLLALLQPAGTGRVIFLTGPWGCGKTHLWNHAISPQLAADKVLTVSLFGAESIAAVKTGIMNESLLGRFVVDKKSQRKVPVVKEAADFLSRLFPAAVKKTVDKLLGVDFLGRNVDALNLVEDGLVICLDDIERASRSLHLEEIFGVATLLAEKKKARVVLILNETRLLDDDDESDVLRKFRERVASHHISIEADIGSMYDLLSSNGEASLAQIKSIKSRVVDIFERSGSSNLRTLRKGLECLRLIADIVGADAVDGDVAQFATAMLLEHEQGNLRSEAFYAFNEIALLMFDDRQKPEGILKERLEFHQRYYGDTRTSEYRYLKSVYDYVHFGYFDEARLSSELKEKEPESLGPVATFLAEVTPQKWFFYSDSEYRDYAQRGAALMSSEVKMNTAEVFALLCYVSLGIQQSGEEIPADFATAVRTRLVENASRCDETFDHTQQIYFEDFGSFWRPFWADYAASLDIAINQALADQLASLVESRNYEALAERLIKNPAALRIVMKPSLLSLLLTIWRTDRRFNYYALSTIFEELEKYNVQIVSELRALRSSFAQAIEHLTTDPSFGNSDRRRFAKIVQGSAGWKIEDQPA